MTDFKKRLKEEIIVEYGSVNKWLEQNSVSPERFYRFMKDDYNPTLKTVIAWLQTVGLSIELKKTKKR